MATLALKPVFPVRTRSSRPKRDHLKHSRALRSGTWRAVSMTTGTVALTFFCVLAPMIDDPAGRLFALDTTSTIPAEEVTAGDARAALAFEFTPTMQGPAIAAEMLTLEEEDSATEEDWAVVTMPELDVSAAPPMDAPEATRPADVIHPEHVPRSLSSGRLLVSVVGFRRCRVSAGDAGGSAANGSPSLCRSRLFAATEGDSSSAFRETADAEADVYLPWYGGSPLLPAVAQCAGERSRFVDHRAVWMQNPVNAARFRDAGINLFVGLWNGPTDEQLATLTRAAMPVISQQAGVWKTHTGKPTTGDGSCPISPTMRSCKRMAAMDRAYRRARRSPRTKRSCKTIHRGPRFSSSVVASWNPTGWVEVRPALVTPSTTPIMCERRTCSGSCSTIDAGLPLGNGGHGNRTGQDVVARRKARHRDRASVAHRRAAAADAGANPRASLDEHRPPRRGHRILLSPTASDRGGDRLSRRCAVARRAPSNQR